MQPNAGQVDSCPMTINSFLAIIGAVTLTLRAAACIPAALAELLRACAPISTAWTELRTVRLQSGARCHLQPRRNALGGALRQTSEAAVDHRPAAARTGRRPAPGDGLAAGGSSG